MKKIFKLLIVSLMLLPVLSQAKTWLEKTYQTKITNRVTKFCEKNPKHKICTESFNDGEYTLLEDCKGLTEGPPSSTCNLPSSLYDVLIMQLEHKRELNKQRESGNYQE